MKKRLLLVGLLFVAIIIAIFFYRAGAGPEKSAIQPITTIAPINPTSMPKPLSAVAISYSAAPTLSFPSTVPHYALSRYRTMQDESSRLAEVFGIPAQPRIISGAKGQYSFSQSGTKSLTLSEQPLTFTYSDASLSGKLILFDPKSLDKTALNQINSLSIVKPPLLLEQTRQHFFAPSGASPNEQESMTGATVIQVDFRFMLASLPVYVNDAETPAFTARFDGAQQLIQLRGFILPDVIKEKDALSIVSYDAAIQRLQNNEGILSSISAGSGNGGFLTGETPTSIQIETATLGYLYLPGGKDLLPVFVFQGTGRITNGKRTINTTTIVSAIP